MRLALAFSERFGHDVVVDLVGYRRFGHNEQDEPAYTQPLMAQAIADHPTVRAQLAERLVAERVGTEEDAQSWPTTHERLRAAHDRLREAIAEPHKESGARRRQVHRRRHGRAADRLRSSTASSSPPDRFTIHPKLVRQLERRHDALEQGGIDWGHAEALALGSLLVEGIPVRLTGQDTERGTFSHRHLVLHDATTGERYAPIQHLADAEASIELHNSPLSEYAALGFDYGYSVAAPETLVLWEAQFGDFVNGAQIIIDQFLVSGLSKWRQTSRLTLLLPHGYEGNGPEHSSARLERFLQSAAQENIRVANPSTAAQYFHLLRRQALDARPRPLITMTPKGLLRLAESAATLEELSTGGFQPVLDDPAADHAHARRLVFCSGKIYYDIAGYAARARQTASPSSASTSSTPSLRAPSPTSSRSTRPSGDRLGAGGAAQHGRLPLDSPPAGGRAAPRRAAPLRRPAVAGEPERGLPDGPPRRAGADRPRGARRHLRRAFPSARASCGSRLAHQRRRGGRRLRPVLARLLEHEPLCAGGSLRHSLYAASAIPIVLFGGMGILADPRPRRNLRRHHKSVTIARVPGTRR